MANTSKKQTPQACYYYTCGASAGRQGFEPRFYGPEPYVLPLDDLPIKSNINITIIGENVKNRIRKLCDIVRS